MTDSRTSKERVYPCGCSAAPADEVPNYCPTHGRPVAEAAYWSWFNSLTPSARRFDLKLDAFCEGWAARGKLGAAHEPGALSQERAATSRRAHGTDDAGSPGPTPPPGASLSAVEAELRRLNDALIPLRNAADRPAAIAMDHARNSIARALHDLRAAETKSAEGG